MSRYISIIFLSAALWACGAKTNGTIANSSEPARGREALTIEYAWTPENMMPFTPAHRSGLVDGKIFYIQDKPEEMTLQFTELDGTPVRAITLPKGKGPGEVVYTVGIRFDEEKFYFMDTVLRRVSVFDRQGGYVDDYPMDAETGRIWKFDIFGGHMYFNSFAKERNLYKFDLTGNVIVKQRGTDRKERPVSGDLFEGGGIEVCPADGKIYYAYESFPVRIEEYNTDLELLRTFTRNDKGHKPMAWSIIDGFVDRHGDVAITSFKVDEKYLYMVNNGADYDNTTDRKEKVDLSVSVFDRKTGRYIKELTVEAMTNKPQYVSIVGVDNDHIILTTRAYEDEKALDGLGLKMTGDSTLAFVVADNPLY